MAIRRAFAGILLLLPLCSSIDVAAQPLGNEGRKIHEIVQNIQQSIDALSKQMGQKRRGGKLYALRGSLYTELYHSLYGSYLGSFYKDIPPELSEAAISAKAIADYDAAIRISPSAVLYHKRGEMHAVQWQIASGINWHEKVRGNTDPERRDFIDWPDEKKQIKVFGEFIQNKNFALAAKDFTKALSLIKEPKTLDEIHEQFARLYLLRSGRVPFDLPLINHLVAEPNQLNYLIWDDIDKAIEHLSKISDGIVNRYGSRMRNLQFAAGLSSLPEIYDYTARLAVDYGKYDIALKKFDAGEKYIDKKPGSGYFACRFYGGRAGIYVKTGNYDSAIKTADAIINRQPGSICENAYESRGDAYLAKGDFQAAVSDYSKVAKFPYSSDVSAYLYRNRGSAYLKLGEAEKAVADLNIYFNYGGAQRTPEDYLLRAEAYRKLGQEDQALEDENRAEDLKLSNANNTANRKRKGAVYGKVLMPDGKPVTIDNSSIRLIYDGERPPGESWPSFDEKGRFSYTNLKHRPFFLFAYFDGEKDGKPGRFYARTEKMTSGDSIIGPLTITLDKFALK